MTLSFDQFRTFLEAWALYRRDEFQYYFPLKGGWELWVQADYAAYVLRQDSTYDILREVPIYTDPYQKVDWLFNDQDTDKTKRIAVEIKCQSFNNWQAFVPGIEDDINKLQQSRIKTQFKTCTTVVMGIYFENEARLWMKSNGFNEIFINGQIGIAIRKLFP